MTPKQNIDHLHALLRERLPDVSVNIDAPERASGSWFVDLKVKGQALVVEFRPKLGFGLSSADGAGYGEGADEFFLDAETVADRIFSLVDSGGRM